MSFTAESMKCERCLPLRRQLRLTPNLIRWRNIAITSTAVYIVLCILLMSVLYQARRSRTVILFNTVQSLLCGGACFAFAKVNFYGMLCAYACLSGVLGLIVVYSAIYFIIKMDAAYLFLHGSMILLMDVPYMVLLGKAVLVYYREWHLAKLDSNEAQPRSLGNARGMMISPSNNLAGAPPQVGMMDGPGSVPMNSQGLGAYMDSSPLQRPSRFQGSMIIDPVQEPPLATQEYSTPEAIETSNEKNVCPICLSNDRDIACVPCGHLLCATCAARMVPTFPAITRQFNCPVCRKSVNQFVKVYM